jgi:hypothetical protein
LKTVFRRRFVVAEKLVLKYDRRNLSAEIFFDLLKIPEEFLTDKSHFRLGIFKKIRDRFDLAVRVDRHADRAVEKYAEIADRPARVIFADQSHAVAERDSFALEPKRDAPNLVEHFPESIFRTFHADRLHRQFVLVRFGGFNNLPAK